MPCTGAAAWPKTTQNYGLARAYYLKLTDRYRNYYYGVAARKRLATLPDAQPVPVASLQRIPGHHKD